MNVIFFDLFNVDWLLSLFELFNIVGLAVSD